MIVWRGYGILAFVLAVLGYFGTFVLIEGMTGDVHYSKAHDWPWLVASLAAAALVFALHVAITKTEKPRVLVDPSNGQEIVLVKKHDLFFVPIKYWPVLLLFWGVFVFFNHT